MPTIYRDGALRFVIYTEDHPPPHVHVIAPDGRAKIGLDDAALLSVRSLSLRDRKRALDIVTSHQATFMREWKKLHG